MIIYKDMLSGDELISDTYDLKDIDDVVFEVDCKMVTKGGLSAADLKKITGANTDKSAVPQGAESTNDAEEEAPPEDDEGPTLVNDVIDGFRLNLAPPYADRKEFGKAIKVFTEKLTTRLKKDGADDPTIESITNSIKSYAAKKMKKWSDYEPYVGESFADDAMPIFLNFREDGSTPYFTIFKYGLVEMKV